MMKLNITYFYSKELNLYGDTGNIDCLKYRAKMRDIDVSVKHISVNDKINSSSLKNTDIIFMGGGPDSSQKIIYKDLIDNKSKYIKDFIQNNGAGLFICGAYQLLGEYYMLSDGTTLGGAHIFDIHTKAPTSKRQKRNIGNIVCKLSDSILNDEVFKNNNYIGDLIVGFENHAGRTFLHKDAKPFATVLKGYGNNQIDNVEGVHYKNSIGTYFHGPLLPKNPHLADYLICKSLKIDKLKKLDDTIETYAHNTALGIKNYG